MWVKGRVGEATAGMGGAGEKVRPLWEWDDNSGWAGHQWRWTRPAEEDKTLNGGGPSSAWGGLRGD